MSYKVLYRKYRPDCFEKVVGQDYTIDILKKSVINNNIAHAYIFSGPRGTGKTSTAKIFAKAINCSSNVNGSPCGKCDFCSNYVDNPDIIEIDAASNNGVDEIREIINNVKITPTNGKYKVYIIDEVHMLTTSAFNALLLTLEEPPAHVVFILATTNVESVPITILSRCQRFDFLKISANDISNYLISICKKEKIKYDEEALFEIAALSDGGLRDALSLLDQLSKSKEKITVDFIEKQIKIVSEKNVLELIDSIEYNNVDDILNKVTNYRDSAVNYKYLIKKIIDTLATRAKKAKKSRKYIRLTFNDYKNLIFDLNDLITRSNVNIDQYLLLEMTLLNYVDETPNNKVSLIQNNIETQDNNSLPNDFAMIRVNNCFVDAKKEMLEQVKKSYDELLSKNIDGKVKSALIDSTPVAASSNYVIFSCESHAANINNELHKEIEDTIKDKLKLELKVVFLSTDEWVKQKNKYIENIKSGIKYELIEEKNTTQDKELDNSIFDKNKLEII